MTQRSAQIETYDRAIGHFARWLTQHPPLHRELRRANPTCLAYAVLPVYAHAVGDADLLRRSLVYIGARCRRDAETFLHSPSRTLVPYRAAWMLFGAVLGQHFTLVRWLETWMMRYSHAGTGGLFGTTEALHAGRGELCFDSTAQACAALCAAGNVAEAKKLGGFLRRFVEAQPDPQRRFLFGWHTERGLITEFDANDPRGYAIDWEQPRQYLYKLALLARAFALLHAATRQKEYLDMAESTYRTSITRAPDVWNNTLAHKIGWAAHTLGLITRTPEYVGDACRIADWLVSLQQDDGGFDYPEYLPVYEQVSDELKCNYGAQFTTWIECARALLVLDIPQEQKAKTQPMPIVSR